MGRLRKLVTGVALSALILGCGSTAEDRLVLQFQSFNGVGITQEDAVRENSADVDVVQDICSITDGVPDFEPFTQTTINAVFRNQEAADIRLEQYIVHVGGDSGLGDIQQSISTNIPGGRCTNVDQQCASDFDCIVGTTSGTCEHTETTVRSLLLFDFLAKASVNPAVYGEGLTITVTFFGSDAANQHFQTTTNYVVTFADFDHCAATSATGGS